MIINEFDGRCRPTHFFPFTDSDTDHRRFLLCVGMVVFSPSENTQRECVHHTTVVYDVAHKEMNVVRVCVLTGSPPRLRASIEVFRLGQEGVRPDACGGGVWRLGGGVFNIRAICLEHREWVSRTSEPSA